MSKIRGPSCTILGQATPGRCRKPTYTREGVGTKYESLRMCVAQTWTELASGTWKIPNLEDNRSVQASTIQSAYPYLPPREADPQRLKDGPWAGRYLGGDSP